MSRRIDWKDQPNGEEVRGPYNGLEVPPALNNSWASWNGLSNTTVWGSGVSSSFASEHSTILSFPTDTELGYLWQELHLNDYTQASLEVEDLYAFATTFEYAIALIDMELWALMEFVSGIQHPDMNYNGTQISSSMHGPNLHHSSEPPHPPTPSPPSTPDDASSPATTSSGNHEYQCWWLPDGGSLTDDLCGETFPDRLAFLRHLAAAHNVSGSSEHLITCRFVDPGTGSFCGTQFTRGNVPRHVDIHYGLRFPLPVLLQVVLASGQLAPTRSVKARLHQISHREIRGSLYPAQLFSLTCVVPLVLPSRLNRLKLSLEYKGLTLGRSPADTEIFHAHADCESTNHSVSQHNVLRNETKYPNGYWWGISGSNGVDKIDHSSGMAATYIQVLKLTRTTTTKVPSTGDRNIVPAPHSPWLLCQPDPEIACFLYSSDSDMASATNEMLHDYSLELYHTTLPAWVSIDVKDWEWQGNGGRWAEIRTRALRSAPPLPPASTSRTISPSEHDNYKDYIPIASSMIQEVGYVKEPDTLM
ncbi:hypothetical protein BU15DRAFT_67661 [Melanogaster broomeanus]|nr:hypothetical protein BU15DRAFT_67661 [Melanogaster broomeanus]